MNTICPVCGLKFEREPGYFVGSMYISYMLAVLIIGMLMFVAAVILPALEYEWILLIATIAFLPFVPIVFRYARVIWMHLDRMIDPDPVDLSSSPKISKAANGLPHRNGHTKSGM